MTDYQISIITATVSFLGFIFLISTLSRLYWKGYKLGFSEGYTSGTKNSVNMIKEWKNNGAIQKIIDDNLDKNPGFLSHMKDVKQLIIASREVWDKYGTSGDPLDIALEKFSSSVKYNDEPGDS